MLDLVFDRNPTDGGYLVRDGDGNLVARIDRHWTRMSFVVVAADGGVLCTVERGGLVVLTWVAVNADDQPVLEYRSRFSGGNISFPDGRSARLRGRFLSEDWVVVDEHKAVWATGILNGSRWQIGGRDIAVRVDDQRLTVAEVAAVVETHRLDHARRRKRGGLGMVSDAIARS